MVTRSTAEDGRHVDERLGVLEGEGATIEVDHPAGAFPTAHHATGAMRESPTYYGLPALKEPVWTATVPVYFYVGGLAGATLVLGGVAQLAGGPSLRALVVRCRRVGLFALVVSGGLLVYDLGRPARFLNMLRVFRPTSPMSVGSWILSAISASTAIATLLPDRPRLLGAAADVGGVVSALLGGPMAGYTGVLLGNTAVPIWSSARIALPVLFTAGAVASAASFLELLPETSSRRGRAARIVRRFGVVGKCAELVATFAVERAVAGHPRLEAPLHEGVTRALWSAAKVLTAASLVISVIPGKQAWKRTAGGALGSLGALAMRFAILQAGRASARDPRATFEPQRDGIA